MGSLFTLFNQNDKPKSTNYKVISGFFVAILLLLSSLVIHNQLQGGTSNTSSSSRPAMLLEKIVNAKDCIKWQRSAFHFQSDKNFMSDPDGPIYHMGWYHLFYQYNPYSSIWGNVTWAHAVSKDLINWFQLPLAMVPDHWYDIKGVFTGSATILPDGRIIMLYTGAASDLTQTQCLAYPLNNSDPLLIHWVKYDGNPVIFPPPGIGLTDFRDPSSMWIGPDGKYRMIMGSKQNDTIGCVLVFHTTDYVHFELSNEVLHSVQGTGMWECVDLYPVSTTGIHGLDMSHHHNLSYAKYVLKQSGDEDRHDWYAIGSYDPFKDKWYPDDPEIDLGIGLRYDYGKFYASKTFYDPYKKRRILWGYVGETDTKTDDLVKVWANIMNIPRIVSFDNKTQTNLIQWPVEEVKSLRSKEHYEFNDVVLYPGLVVPLDIGLATQLDMSVSFEVDETLLYATLAADVLYNCTTSDGAATRGALGPFGVLVLADQGRCEQTPVYFYIAKNTDGTTRTHFCADESRSSEFFEVGKRVYGSTVPVLGGENYTMRLLVDHSIVESFAQGGRTVISFRVYPTKAIYEEARVFLFNNATSITVKASIKIWKMNEAKPKPFPL